MEVLHNDDEASLHERIKSTERHLYPATIKKFLADLEAPHMRALISVYDKNRNS